MTSTGDVVIIGAPRSGTNMLRDVLTSLPEFTTWPCDEINPIWRHGNRDHQSDELDAAQVTPAVRRFIHRRFDHVRKGSPAGRVVEKTCANSLRVEFVRAVMPDAQYVFITRDGLDAAPSAVERWHAPLDLGYTAAKARFVPPSDVPYYGWQFAKSRFRRATRTGGTTGWWGPRLDHAVDLLDAHPLDEVAMLQWKRCVASSRRGLADLGPDQVHHVSYETFVADPVREIERLLSFLSVSNEDSIELVRGVSAKSVGKGRSGMTEGQRSRLGSLASAELEVLGYDTV